MANKDKNTKVENKNDVNVSRETKDTLLVSLAKQIDGGHKALTREVAGETEQFIEFSVETKNKETKETQIITRTSTDLALIENITTIEKLIEFSEASDTIICIAFGRVTKKDAESIGMKKPTDLLKNKFGYRWSDNVICQRYNVAKVFSNPSGEYKWREVVPVDVSISNLEQMLRLCKGYKECKTDKDYETVFNTFYKTYMKTNRLSWYLTQKRLKEEIELILNPKNKVVDGVAKEVGNNSNNSDNNNNDANNQTTTPTDGQNTDNSNTNTENTNNINTNIEDVESKWKTALNSLTLIQTCFKGIEDSEVWKAIEKLSEKITEMLDKVTD